MHDFDTENNPPRRDHRRVPQSVTRSGQTLFSLASGRVFEQAWGPRSQLRTGETVLTDFDYLCWLSVAGVVLCILSFDAWLSGAWHLAASSVAPLLPLYWLDLLLGSVA